MQHAQIEQLGTLDRRIGLAIPVQEIETDVSSQLRNIARTVRIAGFRPGKAPMKLIAQQHGNEVRQEVMGKAIERAFSQAMSAHQLRVAGYPRIEPKPESGTEGVFECYAVFEVFPEVVLGDLSTREIKRPVFQLGEAEVDTTLAVLTRQRVVYRSVSRAAQEQDRLTLDYEGRVKGEVFEGGEAKGFVVVLGAGRTLPEFEQGLVGAVTGETRSVEVNFPADYHAAALAGKKAQFAITVREISEPVLPEVDAEFARSLGIADGDVNAMRTEILANLNSEAQQRVKIKIRDQVFQTLLDITPLELPKVLVLTEAQRIRESAQEDMRVRGMDIAQNPLPVEMIENQAKQRVALGLIVSHIIQDRQLTATQEQVIAAIESLAQSYEDPQSVMDWYRRTPEKMQEVTSGVLEDHVVAWVLSQVKQVDEPMTFEALMGRE
jgi:trigger factor